MYYCYKVCHGHLCHFVTDDTINVSLAHYGEWGENEIYLLSRYRHRQRSTDSNDNAR